MFLGDYIDRGPDTKGCVEALLGFQGEVSAKVVCLLGNHEDWLLRTRRDYRRHSWLLGMEAFDTIRSYSVEAAQTLRDVASKAGSALYLDHCALPYEAFFDCVPNPTLISESCALLIRVPTVCVHGGCIPASDIQHQTREALISGVTGFFNGTMGPRRCGTGTGTSHLSADGWPHRRSWDGLLESTPLHSAC